MSYDKITDTSANINKAKLPSEDQHINLANNMAKDILSYNPEEQNLHMRIKDHRQLLINEAEERLNYLKNSMQEL